MLGQCNNCSDQHPRRPGHIDLVDLTPGGSGLLVRLKDPGRTREWIEKALAIATHGGRDNEGCVNACPERLLTHDNRFEHLHQPLRRRLAAERLNEWLAMITARDG